MKTISIVGAVVFDSAGLKIDTVRVETREVSSLEDFSVEYVLQDFLERAAQNPDVVKRGFTVRDARLVQWLIFEGAPIHMKEG